jgi:hypothetical protein
MIQDVKYSAHKLCFQIYDRATNMAGKFNSCQVIIKAQQPLALYVHCCAHATD